LPRSVIAEWTLEQLIRSHKNNGSKLNKGLQAIREQIITPRIKREKARETERRGTAEGDVRDEEVRKKTLRNLLMSPIVPEGQIAKTGIKRILRVRIWITRMMRISRITLKALKKMKSPPYLRTRIATDK
jgi:hypothetical protein